MRVPSTHDRTPESADSLPASSQRPLLSGIHPVRDRAPSLLWAPALTLAALWALTALSLDFASRGSSGVALLVPVLQTGLMAACFMRVARVTAMHWVLLSVAAFLAITLFGLSSFDLMESRTETPTFVLIGN